MSADLAARWREVAIAHHCRLAVETTHPRFRHVVSLGAGAVSVVLTVNSGYE
jgi:hypothetical protein